MRIPVQVVALSGLFTCGCLGGPWGVWLLEVPYVSEDAEECTEEVTHNFTGATVVEEEEDDGDYTSETTSDRSSSLLFVQIETNSKGEAILVANGEVYPGTETDSGGWVFEWVGTESNTQEDTYTSEYAYTAVTDAQETAAYSLTFEGKSLSGTLDSTSLLDAAYTETDTWSEDASMFIGTQGDIPAATYLEVEGEGPRGGTSPASNAYDAEDCDDSSCELTVTSDCYTTRQVTGTLTGYTDESYDAVEDNQQRSGT